MVSPEMAAREKEWWYDERYAIYDLNVNSATVYPQHNETVRLSSSSTYNVRGYAYSGGGRRINRVEISLDKGSSECLFERKDIPRDRNSHFSFLAWKLAHIDYPEDEYRNAGRNLYGGRIDMAWRDTCFCWCFWNISIDISELETADGILVRAMDEALNIQPRDMYWSVLGMMNNPWFRVKITHEDGVLRFEHPTQPAMIPGGWMERVKKAGGDLLGPNWGETVNNDVKNITINAPVIDMKKPGLSRIISLDEFQKHKSAEEPWFVVEGEVYNGTSFLDQHPGGAQSIVTIGGTDATEEFMAIRTSLITCVPCLGHTNL